MEENVVPQVVEVARGISEYGMLAIAAAAFVVGSMINNFHTRKLHDKLINRIVDNTQITINEISKHIQVSDEKISQVKEALTGEMFNKVRTFAECSFDYNKMQVVWTIAQIKEENNLDDRERVEKKVRLIIDNLYNRRNANFDAFNYNGRELSYYANPAWIEKIYSYCIDSIYDGKEFRRDYYMKNLNHFYDEMKVEFFENLRKK